MTNNKSLNHACCSIGFVLLLFAGMVGVGEIMALRTFPGTEAAVVNVPIASTADEAAAAAEAANSPYTQGYGHADYMASPALGTGDQANWFYGEGEATAVGPVP